MRMRFEKPVDVVEKRIWPSPLFLRAARLSLASILVFAATAAPARQGAPAAGAAPAVTAPQEVVPGVKNFGRVTPQLYRGAQPTAEGFGRLQNLGVSIIVDFRDEKSAVEDERKAVEERRLQFVSIPWNARHDPTPQQIKVFFEVLRAHAGEKIFVHCHYGADRTGTMVAAYRIAAQRWTPDDAIREMKTYHLHAFWFPHLERFVQKFPQQLEADPTLRGSLAASPPTAP